MTDPFDSLGAFDLIKEDVTFVQVRESRKFRSSARAVVVVGSGLSQSAGASVHSETADRFTVTVEKRDFLFATLPKLGDTVTTEKFGTLIVKQCTESERDFVLRCTKNSRGGIPA